MRVPAFRWDSCRDAHPVRQRRIERSQKSRAYAIALAECCECCAAVEIAGALGACAPVHVQAVVELGTRLKNMLSRLVR